MLCNVRRRRQSQDYALHCWGKKLKHKTKFATSQCAIETTLNLFGRCNGDEMQKEDQMKSVERVKKIKKDRETEGEKRPNNDPNAK